MRIWIHKHPDVSNLFNTRFEDLLCWDTDQCCGRLPVFRRILLLPSSGWSRGSTVLRNVHITHGVNDMTDKQIGSQCVIQHQKGLSYICSYMWTLLPTSRKDRLMGSSCSCICPLLPTSWKNGPMGSCSYIWPLLPTLWKDRFMGSSCSAFCLLYRKTGLWDHHVHISAP